jgi:hypothetical protein
MKSKGIMLKAYIVTTLGLVVFLGQWYTAVVFPSVSVCKPE